MSHLNFPKLFVGNTCPHLLKKLPRHSCRQHCRGRIQRVDQHYCLCTKHLHGDSVLSAGSIGENAMDATFSQLREAARANNSSKAADLASQLSGYPLASYVEYYRIKPMLYNSDGTPNTNAPDAEIQQFLSTYAGDAIADRMRNDYALVLGARQDWRSFRTQYAQFIVKDDMQLKCYELMANAAEGQNVVAARTLLTESKHANAKARQQLLSNLANSGNMSEEDINYFAALSAYGSSAQGQALASNSRDASGAARMAASSHKPTTTPQAVWRAVYQQRPAASNHSKAHLPTLTMVTVQRAVLIPAHPVFTTTLISNTAA